MGRRYYENEMVPVTEVVPGDEQVIRRTVTTVARTEAQTVLTFSDGVTETYDMAADPAIEIVKRR